MYEIANTTTLYKFYANERPVGVMSITNTFGAAIFELNAAEAVAAWGTLDGFHGFHRHKVYYTTAGRPFIRKGSLRLYIDQFQCI